jgi:pimeloyl-ACP methyl ester carboxylesterase
MTMRARWLAAAAATVAGLSGVAAPSVHAASPIPTSWDAGPLLLHQPVATAPQLTNSGIWAAVPLLVSGAHAYVAGEFLYQDFLYDDSGANGTVPDPTDPRPRSDAFSSRTGTYDYPTGPGYGGNAADLVELRVKPLTDSTAFRITLTRLADPSLVAATIGIGTRASLLKPFPYGAGVTGQADHFLTVHGTMQNGTPGMAGDFDGNSGVSVSFDSNAAQIEVRVPHTLWDPQGTTVRLSAGVGLWSTSANAYVVPQVASDASHPGGSGILSAPPAFFNVAFREAETPASTAHPNAPSQPTSCMWRDCLQAAALASGSIAQFHDDLDFGLLLASATDFSGVPQTGSIDRILASRFGSSKGVVTYANAASQVDPSGYAGEYQDNLQPYNLYVPARPMPAAGFPLTLLLHSLSANYNQYMGSNNQTEYGNRAVGSLVATAESRGPDGWYYDKAEADVFEMWDDIARFYQLDLERTTVTGYSMGGYAAYRFSTRFPDLFAKAYATVGPPADGIWLAPGIPSTAGNGIPGDPTNTYYMLDSLRWVPFLIWHGTNDELVPAEGPQFQARRFDDLGYRYEIDTFPGYDHFAFAFFDNFTYPTQFLGSSSRVTDPPRVTYVVNPTMDFAADSEVADHAYWLGGLTIRSASLAPRGTIDVRSEGFCVGDAPVSATQFGSGMAATPYTREFKTWGTAPSAPCADTLDVTATNIGRVVIDTVQARVDCNARVNLHADAPVEVDLVSNGSVCPSSGTLQPASSGGATVANPGGAVSGLPNTAAMAARPVGLPAAAVLLAAAGLGRRRRRREGQARP